MNWSIHSTWSVHTNWSIFALFEKNIQFGMTSLVKWINFIAKLSGSICLWISFISDFKMTTWINLVERFWSGCIPALIVSQMTLIRWRSIEQFGNNFWPFNKHISQSLTFIIVDSHNLSHIIWVIIMICKRGLEKIPWVNRGKILQWVPKSEVIQ